VSTSVVGDAIISIPAHPKDHLMRLLSTLPKALALSAILFSATSLGATEPIDVAQGNPIINTVCPMDGKAVNDKSTMVPMTIGEGATAKHYRMGMCSAACHDEMMKDPQKALAPRFGKESKGPKTNPM